MGMAWQAEHLGLSAPPPFPLSVSCDLSLCGMLIIMRFPRLAAALLYWYIFSQLLARMLNLVLALVISIALVSASWEASSLIFAANTLLVGGPSLLSILVLPKFFWYLRRVPVTFFYSEL